MSLYLGVDTSAYTTSLCLVSSTGEVVGEVRKVLTVPHGQQGLRQSEAVFQHIQNLPTLAKDLREQLGHGWKVAGCRKHRTRLTRFVHARVCTRIELWVGMRYG